MNLKRGLDLIKSLPAGLLDYYSAPQLPLIKRLRDGFIYFSVGLVCIYMANISMQPSWQQEIVVLIGLLFAVIGFLIGMLAYVRIVISRIVRFFREK